METLTTTNHLPPGQPQPPPFVIGQIGGEQAEESFDFWGVLNRRKWLVFLGLVVGMGLGGLYQAKTDVIYESRATLKIEPKNPLAMRFTNTEVMAPGMELMSYRHDRVIGTDNKLLLKCLETNSLYGLDSFADMTPEQVVPHVRENLEVLPDKEEAFIYELSYRARDAYDAKTVLNNIIATYESNLNIQYRDESEKFITLLKEVKNQFENSYTELEKEVQALLEQNTAPTLGSQGQNIHQFYISELSQQIGETQDQFNMLVADRARVMEALEAGEEAIEQMFWILIQNKRITLSYWEERQRVDGDEALVQSISRMELALREQSYRLGASHPTIRSLKGQIEYWKEYLAKSLEEKEATNNAGVDAELSLRRYLIAIEQQTEYMMASLTKDLETFNMHVAEEEKLSTLRQKTELVMRQRDNVYELLNDTTKKMLEIDPEGTLMNRSNQEGFRFDRLMDATLGEKVWPILPFVLGIGGLLGTLAGFGLGCLVELADKTFHNPDEIMKQLNLPLIGHIPVISSSKRYLVENSLIDPIVCTYHRPKSQVAEAFRAVRTALFFNTQGLAHQVVQITSPTPGDGKSTLAANLATSIAQSGKRVLLVDGDMRRPRQNITFGITSKEGFATVLSGTSNWRDVVFECDEIEGLSVMPCGAKPNNPAELSTSPQVKELIEEMREEFDFVVIDTPPLLAVTDPCPIAARVDGVILTLRIKKNVRVSAERAADILHNLGANVFGLVVNGVGAQTGYGSNYTYGAYRAGYAYNGYGYGYGYGYGPGKYYEDEKGRRRQVKNIEQQPPVV